MTQESLAIERLGSVAHLRWSRPPHNHVDADFMRTLADALDALDADASCRAVLLSAQGRVFCAGADFRAADLATLDPEPFYRQALRLFRTRKPIVAAVNGPAIGAGMGLALVADFRIGGPGCRFAANFVRLGFHPGFGLSATLPRLVGVRQATALLCTGRRIDGGEALRIGLIDALAPDEEQVFALALAQAQELASGAPVAVQSTRETLRAGLAEQVAQANERELALQRQQFTSADFREGIAAAAARRDPVFTGR